MTGIPFGKYQLVKRLARGGMAEVFLARQSGPEGFQRMVAVKRILPHLVDSQDFVRMFLDEARLAAQLSHPNVVHIYDFGKVDEHYFIAMEYVEGVHAGELIKHAESERLPDVLVARIGADACAGLHYAHEVREAEGRALQIVHRDVSPPNLLASYDGAVKLVDFGIAKAVGSIEETRPGVVKGKFAYMSPEQTIGQKLDGRSDVFSLAVVLWELLAGRFMVPRQDPVDGMRMIRDGRVPPIEQERPDIAPALGAALTRALRPRRDDRSTALELGRALEEFIKGSRDGIGSALELADWLRQRFPRDGQPGNQLALDEVAVGTRPATGATHAALPLADRNVELPMAAATSGSASQPAARAATQEATQARVMALSGPGRPRRADATDWDPPPARAGLSGHTRSGGRRDDSMFDAESSSVIVAPDWMVEESGPAFDTLAEGSAAESLESEAEDTHDFRRPIFDTDTVITRIRRPPARDADASNAVSVTANAAANPAGTATTRTRPSPLTRKLGRLVLIVAAGTSIGVSGTLVLRQLTAWSESPVQSGAPRPAPSPAAHRPPPLARPLPAPVRSEPSGPATAPSEGGRVVGAPSPAVAVPASGAFIEVVTKPPGARVALGDMPLAGSPAQFPDLAAGTYPLRVSERGYQSVERTIEVTSGERRTVEIELVPDKKAGARGDDRKRAQREPQPPASGVLKVRTRPSSDVYLEGRHLGQTPLVTELKPGRYTLVFKHPGKPNQRKTITVREGNETKLDFALD